MMKTAYKILKEKQGPKYREVAGEEIGISFSSAHLMLSSSFTPQYYEIVLTSDLALSLEIESRSSSQISISPSSIHLSPKSRSVRITVESSSMHNEEVDIIHYSKGSNIYCTLKLYVLGPEGVVLYTAGSDEHYQLAHKYSQGRLLEEIESSLEKKPYQAKRTTVLRPTPEIVQNNDDTLMLFPHGAMCYVEYPYWVGISGGDLHSLACTSDGRLYSWGTGIFGQLGLPPSIIKARQSTFIQRKGKRHWETEIKDMLIHEYPPENIKEAIDDACKTVYVPVTTELLQVPIPHTVQAVACGQFHSVVLSEGVPYTFGLGLAGRLGNGLEENSQQPFQVQLLEPCIKIAAGYHNSFFVLQNRTVYSCGDFSEGALGHDSHKFLPTLIPFLSRVCSISSALSHTAVVTIDGSAVLFGSNEDSKLGGASPHTIKTIEGRKLRGVFCGGRHTCALTNDLEVYAWGHNTSGQLGLSSTMFYSMSSPVKIEYLSGRFVVNMALGMEHSMAITADGLLYCWGSNTKGQLAIGTLAKEFNRVGLPRLIDKLLGQPVTCITASRHGSIFAASHIDPKTDDDMFLSWKKILFGEERHRQELANYRFSLLIRDLKRDTLVNKVQQERDSEWHRDLKKTRRSSVSLIANDYSSVWNSNSFVDTKKGKTIYRFGKRKPPSNPKKNARKHHKHRSVENITFDDGNAILFNPRNLLF